MRNVRWAFETSDVIAHRKKTQIQVDTVPRGKITCRTVDQAFMKKRIIETADTLGLTIPSFISPVLSTS